MRALIVYESMFGNTHLVADEIATGLGEGVEVTVTSVGGADAETVAGIDLLVVGGPTHVHGMTSSRTRAAAADQAEKDDDLDLDPDAEGPGLRDWFDGLPEQRDLAAAAFDTRIDGPAALTGRASKGIARRLKRHGCRLVAGPESFLVDKGSHLLGDQAERARAFGASLATALAGSTDTTSA